MAMLVEDRLMRLRNQMRRIEETFDPTAPGSMLDDLEHAMTSCYDEVLRGKRKRDQDRDVAAAARLEVGTHVRMTWSPIGWGRAHGNLLVGRLKKLNRTTAREADLPAGYGLVEFTDVTAGRPLTFTSPLAASTLEPCTDYVEVIVVGDDSDGGPARRALPPAEPVDPPRPRSDYALGSGSDSDTE